MVKIERLVDNQKYISIDEFQKLRENCLSTNKPINGFISYLQEKRKEKELAKLS